MRDKISRRDFIKWGATGAGVATVGALSFKENIISSLFPKFQTPLGHRLWKKDFPEPSSTRSTDICIVGGGITALSAGWYLSKYAPQLKWEMHEIENQVGGNSVSGKNQVSAYPWGAHYVPFVNKETKHVREIFEDLGVIVSYKNGIPVYNEEYVCADPEERLLFRGHWHEGIIPTASLNEAELEEYKRFFSHIEKLRFQKGKDGKLLFTLPLSESSKDKDFRALDKLSFTDYLDSLNFKSEYLRWYLDYCCKDDFGALAKDVSAWAGLHYFCARRGEAANGGSSSLVTWPQGNGWLVEELKKKCNGDFYTQSIAYEIKNTKQGVEILVYNAETNKSSRIQAKSVILSTPLFVSAKIFPDIKNIWSQYKEKFHHSPWLIANITLKSRPAGKGFPLAWDNVNYYSSSIGYVVANHQTSTSAKSPTVITLYSPIVDNQVSAERHKLLLSPDFLLKNQIIKELSLFHKEIEKEIADIQLKVWGHGMIRPSIDFIWSGIREKFTQPFGRVLLAHTDLSGISLFEEASYHGVRTARQILKWRENFVF